MSENEAAHGFDVLQKPYELTSLAAAIRKVLRCEVKLL